MPGKYFWGTLMITKWKAAVEGLFTIMVSSLKKLNNEPNAIHALIGCWPLSIRGQTHYDVTA